MIRQAEKRDRQELAALVLVILKDMELPLLNELPELTMLEVLADAVLESEYRYSYTRGIVYEQGGKIAGAAFGYSDEEEVFIDTPLSKVLKAHKLKEDLQLFVDKETFADEWYLDTISVDKAYRGMGIGSKLLEALPKVAEKAGKSVIGLNVDQGNPKAEKLYERHGFKVVGELTLSGHRYNHMQKKTGL